MRDQRTPELDALYERGMEHFRAADWNAAVDTFSELRVHSVAYPEVDALIADALLKIEIERAKAPEARLAPKPSGAFQPRFLIAVPVLLLLGAALLIAFRPFGQAANTAAVPTPAVARPTPAPTSTPQPTPPVFLPPGAIQVRMAGGQPLVRTTGNIEIILDASGSMRAKVDGRPKFEIAREALGALVAKLPDSARVALRAYGHHRPNDCNDVELVAPLGPLDRARLTEQINAVNPAPNGMTPLGASLQQVVEDLKGASGDTLVVLVTDGEETCNGDPVAVAGQVRAANPQMKIDVIGFNVGADLQARLSDIATAGGGSYFDAGSAAQLADALQQAVALTYRVFDGQGNQVYEGTLGSTAQLPGGRYKVVINGDTQLQIADVLVSGDKPAVIELREQDGKLAGEVVGAP